MKMTPEHHRAVAEVWERPASVDHLEARLRRWIANGAGWRPYTAPFEFGPPCMFCGKGAEGMINKRAMCGRCLREYAGPRWAVIAMLRTPAVGEHTP